MFVVKNEITEMFLLKYRIHIFFTLIINLFVTPSMLSQPINLSDTVLNETITHAVINSDLNGLEKMFHKQIDLVLLGESGIYSKVQAKFILKDFFAANKPESFKIINENTNKGSNFIVGKLHTADRQFRVCFLTKQSQGATLIYQVRIEE